MNKSVFAVIITLGLIAVLAVNVLKGPDTTITLSGARAELQQHGDASLHVFVNIQNGAQPDKLIGVMSDAATMASLVANPSIDSVPIPANSTPVLSADGAFIELLGVEGNLEEGQFIPFSLEFETSGKLTTRAIISAAVDPHAAHIAMVDAGTFDVPLLEDGQSAPSIDMTIEQSSDGSWTVELELDHFTFDADSPEPVHVPSHGHAHLYIDGLKLQRVFGPTATIGPLPSGTYSVKVSVNTNDHRPYMNDLGAVEAIAQIVVE